MNFTNVTDQNRFRLPSALFVIIMACIMAGCTVTQPVVKRPPANTDTGVAAKIITPPKPFRKPEIQSTATNDKDYRKDAAKHLYSKYNNRIFQGKMPPLLYAVGVLEIDIDDMGFVSSLRWMRAPSHAPEVVAEIERSIREAAPFPAPSHTSRVTYIDTWLWHKSGRFQLDTLTLGQL